MSNFTSTIGEEILAVLETVKWLEKHESEFCIPPYYKKYMANLIHRFTEKKEQSND